MTKSNYKLISTVIALIFWLIDSAAHKFLFNEATFEIFPSDTHDLWMRVVIFILITSFGFFVDYHSRKILEQTKELERSEIYKATLRASHHILNNLLNQMEYFKIEAKNCHDFNRETLEFLDQASGEAIELIEKLSTITEINTEVIEKSIHPTGKK
ncbi:MAG: hypothetical protein OEY43_09110 [Gammaproteobacteria bacterium]|nr:hypothetical protein [Gammaproteobacteria bacterium]